MSYCKSSHWANVKKCNLNLCHDKKVQLFCGSNKIHWTYLQTNAVLFIKKVQSLCKACKLQWSHWRPNLVELDESHKKNVTYIRWLYNVHLYTTRRMTHKSIHFRYITNVINGNPHWIRLQTKADLVRLVVSQSKSSHCAKGGKIEWSHRQTGSLQSNMVELELDLQESCTIARWDSHLS